MMKRIFLFIIIAIIALSTIAWAYTTSRNFRITQERIETIPSFSLLLVDSITLFNTNQFSMGKPVLLMYFSPDCEHCHAQTERLIKNINALKDVQIFLLTPMPLNELKDFYKKFHLSDYKNIMVGQDYEYAFYKYFKPSIFPYIAIYDRQKRLVKSYKGETNISKIIRATESPYL